MFRKKLIATLVFAAMLVFALNSFAANNAANNRPSIGTITFVTTMNTAEMMNLQALTGREVSAVARPEIALTFANSTSNTVTNLILTTGLTNNKKNTTVTTGVFAWDGGYRVIVPTSAEASNLTKRVINASNVAKDVRLVLTVDNANMVTSRGAPTSDEII